MFRQTQPRRAALCGYCLLPLLLLSSATAYASASSEMLRTQALFLLQARDYPAAVALLTEAVAADREDHQARYQLALALSRQGDYSAAVTAFQQLPPTFSQQLPQLPFEYGFAAYRAANYAVAEPILRVATAQPSATPLAHYYLGVVRFRLHDYSGSLDPLQQAASGAQEIAPAAHFLRARALLALGQPAAASAAAQPLIDHHADSIYLNPARELQATAATLMGEGWRFRAEVGVAHDDNIALLADTLAPSDAGLAQRSDRRLQIAAAARYRQQRGDWQWQFGYDLFSSRHQQLATYDLDSHAITLDLRPTTDPESALSWGVVLLGQHAQLGHNGYLNTLSLLPNLHYRHSEGTLSLLRLQLQHRDYLNERSDSRDGNTLQLGYRHYWHDDGWRSYVGTRIDSEGSARAADRYRALQLELGGDRSWHDYRFAIALQFAARDYYANLTDRADQRREVTLSVTRPVTPQLDLELRSSWLDNRSSLDNYDYDRQQLLLLLRWAS